MPDRPSTPLEALERRLGYSFDDRSLLERAVTHPSYLPGHPEAGESNQRLEFLGDAVLQLILTGALYEQYPEEREGPLSKRRAVLANGVFLASLAREIGLDACLRMSAGEEASGGRERATALGDALEALFGALFKDSDLTTTRKVVLEIYGSLPLRLASAFEADNPKGQLQEIAQPIHGNAAIRYEVVGTAGEDHAREFEVSVFLNDRRLGTGRGSSKKLAEEAAARAALETLKSQA